MAALGTGFYLFIYLFLAALGLHCYMGFSLVVAIGGLRASNCGDFSCGAPALGCSSFSS